MLTTSTVLKATPSAAAPSRRRFLIPDAICAVFLALCPLLQHYKGLIGLVASSLLSNILPSHYINLADNMTITLLLLMAPYMLVRGIMLFKAFNLKRFLLLSPLFLFYVYKVVAHGTSIAEIFQVAISLGYLLALALGCIDLKKLVLAASVIASAASVLIIVQYFCYYALDFHLQLVPTSLLLPSAEQWIGGAQTGRISVTGSVFAFYRPCAFFLEPSHMFLYLFPLLFINLYKTGKNAFNWVAGVLISIGILFSTSGMGMLAVFGAWVLFAAIWDRKSDSLKPRLLLKLSSWARALCAALALLIVVLAIPSFNSSIARIVGRSKISISMFLPDREETPLENEEGSSNEGGLENAPSENSSPEEKKPEKPKKTSITGRTRGAIKIIKSMSLKQLVFGCADSVEGISAHMPGFASTLYKYGLIGILLSYIFFLFGLLKLNANYFWATVIWVVTSFFSIHTHGMIYILFYIMLFYNGHLEANGSWGKEIKSLFKGPFGKDKNKIEAKENNIALEE